MSTIHRDKVQLPSGVVQALCTATISLSWVNRICDHFAIDCWTLAFAQEMCGCNDQLWHLQLLLHWRLIFWNYTELFKEDFRDTYQFERSSQPSYLWWSCNTEYTMPGNCTEDRQADGLSTVYDCHWLCQTMHCTLQKVLDRLTQPKERAE